MTEISDPIRTVLQGYLEVLYLACDLNSNWTASDLHAAFEWALTLYKLTSDPSKSASVASTAEILKPLLPCIIQDALDEVIKSPTEVLLRRLLIHNTASGSRNHHPDWTLKVLAAHTSACSLPEPCLERDVHSALINMRERASCESLLQAASRDAAVEMVPSTVHQLALAAPSWLPYPAPVASEYLYYFSRASTLELAAAATLLRKQLQQQQSRITDSGLEVSTAIRTERIETTEPAAARAELLAMALCLPLPQYKPSQLEQLGISVQRAASPEQERTKRKLLKRLPEDPLAQELCSLLRFTPSLAAILPAPLLSRACRSSFPLSVEYAAALEKLRVESSIPVTAVISALKFACLINDTTALLFKDALGTIYRSI
ncbi:hypothetical protein Ndes2437B_g08489 [Nannochloris sp. 'desiccata']